MPGGRYHTRHSKFTWKLCGCTSSCGCLKLCCLCNAMRLIVDGDFMPSNTDQAAGKPATFIASHRRQTCSYYHARPCRYSTAAPSWSALHACADADDCAGQGCAGSPVRPGNVPVLQQDAASNGTSDVSSQALVKGDVVHPNQGAPTYPSTGTTIHTLCTSNGSPYLNFQTRIM